jgi:hypothetical protein
MATATNILPKDINKGVGKNQFTPVGRSLPREIVKWI